MEERDVVMIADGVEEPAERARFLGKRDAEEALLCFRARWFH